MTKILKVIKPFFVMEIGDTFEFDSNTNQYKSVYNEEHNESNDENSTMMSSYNSEYTISEDYAKMLVDNGYLIEVGSKENTFINIFDEIQNLLIKYNNDLTDLLNSTDDIPQCLKVEKETVLRNMIKLLTHLASLKK
mgnify:CR=1 FL=1|nr:MAG TPA: hypothetical protein [Caudoviricetes sp.]